MFKKLDGMLVRKKMITGYLIVIVLMVFSGILAIEGETILLRNLSNYSNKVQRADTAVQMCRLNVNIAARNIREMALNDDKSSYDTYKKNNPYGYFQPIHSFSLFYKTDLFHSICT